MKVVNTSIAEEVEVEDSQSQKVQQGWNSPTQSFCKNTILLS